MFVELMPLLKDRTLLITVARVDEKLKVNVIPARVKEGDDHALTTPLSFTGSAEELDSELGGHLASYVDSHLALGNTLAEAKAQMDAAAKAARQKVKTTQQASKPDPAVTKKDEPPRPTAPAADTTPSLFAPGPEGTLYLIVDPDSAAFALLNPVLELLERIHPRLPATFFTHFAGSLNRWVRVYDYHDAEERVDMLREWYEGEENPEQYEVRNIEGCTPKCLKERPLSLPGLKLLSRCIRSREVRALVSGLLELCRISQQAKRPEFTEDMGEQLMDSNPPLPCLLAAFSAGNAVVGCFDDEAQTAMEVTPQPNLIIPLKLSDPTSVRQGFRTLGVVCDTWPPPAGCLT